jgi:hypothetical protein
MNELDELLEIVPVTPTDPAADAARGLRALRRRRRTQVSAAVLSVVAVVAVGFAVRDTSGSPHAAGFAGGPGAGQTARDHAHHGRDLARPHPHRHFVTHCSRCRFSPGLDSPSSQDAIQSYHDVLADHLDPQGDLLAAPSNVQSGGSTLGSKFDWNHGGMLEIMVGHRFSDAASFYSLETAGMTPTTYHGRPARVSTTGSDLVVSVQHPDGTVVTLIASNGFDNNGTSTSVLGLTQRQLLAAASDDRLTPPGAGR